MAQHQTRHTHSSGHSRKGKKRKPMSAGGRAKLSRSLKAAAARRKAAGIKIHHKPLTAAQKAARHAHNMDPAVRAKRSAAMKKAAAARKAKGIKIHRKPMTAAQRAHLSAALKASAARRKAAGIKGKKRVISAATRAKMRANGKKNWAKLSPEKKKKIENFLRYKASH